MIDRALRDRYGSALRQLLAGHITNWQFEGITEGEVLESGDRVLVPVYWRAWSFYNDGTWVERVDRSLANAVRSDVARWILFLQTDLEYRWPEGPLDGFGCFNLPMNLLTLGWWERRKAERLRAWERNGDVSVWPFFEQVEFDRACQSPRFLVGSG